MQLAKLYLCAMANAFVYSGKGMPVPCGQGMGLQRCLECALCSPAHDTRATPCHLWVQVLRVVSVVFLARVARKARLPPPACPRPSSRPAADPARAARTYLSLPATTVVQSLCALVPSIAVYRLEAGLRRWA